MFLRQAYKYRLNTKPVDELLMQQFSGCCRFVWNKALALQKERLDAGERTLSYNKLAVLLPSWKKEHLFLNDAPSQALQQVLKNLETGPLRMASTRSNRRSGSLPSRRSS
jgi:putative transposase